MAYNQKWVDALQPTTSKWKRVSPLPNLCMYVCVNIGFINVLWQQRTGLSLRYPTGICVILQSCLHPHWDSVCAPGSLYSWRGVSNCIPWDPFARPWLILPLLHHAATLIHSKMLSSNSQIASAVFNKQLQSIHCQISHKFKVEPVASFSFSSIKAAPVDRILIESKAFLCQRQCSFYCKIIDIWSYAGLLI